MEVAVTELRAHLSDWLDRVREGHEVIITERGVPVARLHGVGTTTSLERLVAEGVVGKPSRTGRPTASGRARPRARRSLAEVVSEQRR